jgi:hypothetical protein
MRMNKIDFGSIHEDKKESHLDVSSGITGE